MRGDGHATRGRGEMSKSNSRGKKPKNGTGETDDVAVNQCGSGARQQAVVQASSTA